MDLQKEMFIRYLFYSRRALASLALEAGVISGSRERLHKVVPGVPFRANGLAACPDLLISGRSPQLWAVFLNNGSSPQRPDHLLRQMQIVALASSPSVFSYHSGRFLECTERRFLVVVRDDHQRRQIQHMVGHSIIRGSVQVLVHDGTMPEIRPGRFLRVGNPDKHDRVVQYISEHLPDLLGIWPDEVFREYPVGGKRFLDIVFTKDGGMKDGGMAGIEVKSGMIPVQETIRQLLPAARVMPLILVTDDGPGYGIVRHAVRSTAFRYRLIGRGDDWLSDGHLVMSCGFPPNLGYTHEIFHWSIPKEALIVEEEVRRGSGSDRAIAERLLSVPA